MKKRLLTTLALALFSLGFAQDLNDLKIDKKKVIASAAKEPCSCMDTINTANKERQDLNKEINSCIKPSVTSLNTALQLMQNIGKSSTEININVNEKSEEYQAVFNTLRDYLLENCERMKTLMLASDLFSENSITSNPLAYEFYHAGNKESEKGNWEEAIKNYKLAVQKDPNFPFAWDNLGVAYRQQKKFDLAIDAYQNSLKVDPKGKMPLQNLAVAYIYNAEYKKAVKAFENFGKIYPDDPESYYGLGQLYYNHLIDYEKSLDQMCKAFVLYKKTESPYQSHAEEFIKRIYIDMKKENKLDTFAKILKKNNINTEN